MKIVTWNINSVRIRLPAIKQLIEDESPDIIGLQETKVEDHLFPLKSIEALGYEHCYYRGEKSYNGVAILSKIKPIETFSLDFVKNDARHLAIKIDGDIELHNFYVPAGGDEPDTSINPKFDHKLKYLDQKLVWLQKYRSPNDKIIILGDLNISPYEHDVWSSYQLRNDVSHTMIEREKHIRNLNSLNFIDVGRKYVPYDQKLFSWWSYRNRDWKKSNRGRRLDHIWVTKPLENQIKNFYILNHARDWAKPSDHVPVICELA